MLQSKSMARPPALRKLLITTMILACHSVAVLAAPDIRVDIAAQPLSSALRDLASQAGVQLVFAAETVGAAEARAIKGEMSVDAALRKLLVGSGLEFRKDGDNSYVIVRSGHSENVLPEMVITATRTERAVDEVPASVSVLTDKALATKSRQNVYDALRDFEGLDFGGQMGVGHQVSPGIRGFSDSGKTTQVLVDGISLDSVVSEVMGRGGLNFTSLQDVERIEVVRGPASALYGPSAVGGVINVIPKRWKGAPGAEVNAAYGLHNTQTLGAALGVAKDNFDIRLSVYDAKSDGYKAAPVADRSGGWDLGGRAWKDKKASLFMGIRPADNHEFTLGFQGYETESAGYGGRSNDGGNMNGNSATLGYRYDLNADTNIKVNFRSTQLKQKYKFDSWDWYGLTTPGIVATSDLVLAYYGERDSRSTAFQALLETRLLPENQLIVGYGHDTGDHKSWGMSVGGTKSVRGSKSQVDALFVQDEHKFGALTLTAGGRYDRIDLSPETIDGVPQNGDGSVANVFNPRLGARYHITDATSVYAAYGTAYVPALNPDKFVQPSTTRVDNPDLKPETSATYEIGMNNKLNVGTLRTAIFHTEYEDKITLGIDAASGKRQWQNVAVVKVDGIEIAYQGHLGQGWYPYANFSYTKARDYATSGATGTQSTRISPRKFNAGVTYTPSDSWSATLNARYVSGLYFNSVDEAEWADGYTQVDVKATYTLPVPDQKLQAFFAVSNLTNKKHEVSNKTEWSDGRTFMLGLNGRF